MLFLSYYYLYRYDIFTELLTPDPKAIIAFVIGGFAGLLGCFLRFGFRKERDKGRFYRVGDYVHYVGWPAFGSFAAMTLNTFPWVSFIVGLFAPLFYKALETMIKKDPLSFIPFLKGKKD